MSANDAAWVQRYLGLLGLSHEQPGFDSLCRLTRAHLLRVPFENVTSLLRRAAAPDGPVPELDPELVLGQWEKGRSGGLCFEVTTMLAALLNALGYEARRVLGRITFPGSHQAVIVGLEGREYLVDLGCGAPLFEPIPLDESTEVHRAGLSYRFRREDGDTFVQDRLIEGAWQPFCFYDLRVAGDPDCAAAYQRHHVPFESWVVSSLTLVRCREDEVLQLRDGRFTRYSAEGKSSGSVVSPGDYARLVRDALGLPDLPIDEGVAAFESITGKTLDT